MQKVRNEQVTEELLRERERRAHNKGYQTQQWIRFARAMLERRYRVNLYEANRTFSKYLTVWRNSQKFKVRFSNHKPAFEREMNGDCDFFVGRCHTGTTTTQQAIDATIFYLESREA